MSTAEIGRDMLAAIKDLRAAQLELGTRARDYAQAERDYRRAKSIAYWEARSQHNAETREAFAEQTVVNGPAGRSMVLTEWRYLRDDADALRTSALEAVRSHRGILSALQSLSSLERSEAELAKYQPAEVGA